MRIAGLILLLLLATGSTEAGLVRKAAHGVKKGAVSSVQASKSAAKATWKFLW